MNYLHDWLIAAQSRELAVEHVATIVRHLDSLSLRIKAKSRLVPLQWSIFLGLRLDSCTMPTYLSPDRVAAICTCLSFFQLGRRVQLVLFQRLLGLMAAASVALPLSLLWMCPIQAWLNSFRLHPKRDRHRRVTVSPAC